MPELASSNHMMRAFGERVAMNMPIQGTAADIIKIAMIRVDNRLEKENMKSRLILQVHDELIVEAPLEEADKALQIVTEEMENACKFSVKLLGFLLLIGRNAALPPVGRLRNGIVCEAVAVRITTIPV